MRITKSPTELGFRPTDAAQLLKALKRSTDKRTFRRVQAVLLIAQGYSFPEVAKIVAVSRQTIYNWVDLFLAQHQVSALYDSPPSGRPTLAKPITATRILRELQRNPLRLGYRATVWTLPLLAQRLSQLYHCAITPHTLRRRMKEIGLTCKRPRYVYEEKDPHRAQKKGLLSVD
jgi:transposase